MGSSSYRAPLLGSLFLSACASGAGLAQGFCDGSDPETCMNIEDVDGHAGVSLLQLSAQFQSIPQVVEAAAASAALVKRQTVLETCSMEQWEESLNFLLENRLLNQSDSVARARARYQEFASGICEPPNELWPTSGRRLVANVGQGTTGTGWLSDIMRRFGFTSAHNGCGTLEDKAIDGTYLEHACGTDEWDMYDYISDTPVPRQVWQILHSHPHAVYLMSIRDGAEWQEARLRHPKEGSKYNQPTPCGIVSNHTLGDEDAPASMVAYNAWAACVLPREKLFAFNLWTMTDHSFVDQLDKFLARHGLKKGSWTNVNWLNIPPH